MIKTPTVMRAYNPISHFKFDTTAEPTIEDATAVNYATGAAIADGGQVINAMDGHPGRFLTVNGDLLTGDDSTFDSDTGNWDTSDAGVSITGGALVFLNVATGDGAEIVIPLPTGAVGFRVIYTVADYGVGGPGGSFRAVLGGTNGSILSGNGAKSELISTGGTAVLRIQAFANPSTFKVSSVTVHLEDTFRIDLEANSRQSYNSLVLDGNNLLTSLPASMQRNLQAFYGTVDTFGSATEITPTKVISGLLGENAPFLDFDGVDDYVSVANDANLNFGANSDFTLSAWIRTTGGHSADYARIMQKGNAGGSYYALMIRTTGEIVAGMDDGATEVLNQSTLTVNDGVWHHVLATYDRDGNSIVYIDGVADGTADISSVGDIDDATKVLAFGVRSSLAAAFFKGDQKDTGLYNRALSAAEVLARFNGGEIATADRWGQQAQYASDFSAGVDGWASGVGGNLVLTGNIDSIGGVDDTLRCAAGADVSFNTVKTSWLTIGQRTRVTFDYYADSGSGVANFGIGASGARAPGAINNIVVTSDDAWHTGQVLDIIPDNATRGIVGYTTTTGDSLDDLLNGKNIYFKNIQVDFLGAVAEWASEGISSDQGKWFDNSDNLLTGTIIGAEVFNGPDSDNLGFILYEFTAIDLINLFWFFQQNQDADTALADIKDGWLPLCQYYDFNIKDYGGNYAFPGVKSAETESGDTNAEKFFGRKPTWSVPLQPMNDANFENIQKLADTVEGKLLPFHVRFASESLDGTVQEDNTLWRVRLAENGIRWTFVFGSEQPWNVTLQLVADIN